MMQKQKIVIDDNAIVGLPMRLTVSLIIGSLALIAILSFILNPCLFPGGMIVSVDPMVMTVSGDEPENVTFMVHVTTMDGHPLSGASVLIKGLGGAQAGFTDANGTVLLQLRIVLVAGTQEGYLDVSAKAGCRDPFDHHDMIKIVKSR